MRIACDPRPCGHYPGWVDVDLGTMRHKHFTIVFALGDAGTTPNAKTTATARKQAPVVANNVLVGLGKATAEAKYDGYGSCPLTVEPGKIVLAEFVYARKLAPSFPKGFIDGTAAVARRVASQRTRPSAFLLGRHAQRTRMAGAPGDDQLNGLCHRGRGTVRRRPGKSSARAAAPC